MDEKRKLAAPCGLYCGVCAIYIAHKEGNRSSKKGCLRYMGLGWKRFTAKDASQTIYLNIAAYARSGPVSRGRVSKDAISATIFPASVSRIFPSQ